MAKKVAISDEEQVKNYMSVLEHPLKAEIEMLRFIIKNANPKINERIKWNAPSYYYLEDIVTFGPPARKSDEILLVFHHPSITHINSPILHGDFKDRRLAYFKNIDEIQAETNEITRILTILINNIDNK